MNSFFYKNLTGWLETRGQRVSILRESVFPSPEGSLKRVGINAHPTQTGMVRTNSCA